MCYKKHPSPLVGACVEPVETRVGGWGFAILFLQPSIHPAKWLDLFTRLRIAAKGTIHTVIEVFTPYFLKQIFEQFSGFLACLHHKIEHVQACQNSITLWDIPTECVSAAFLAADERIGLGHLRRNEFE